MDMSKNIFKKKNNKKLGSLPILSTHIDYLPLQKLYFQPYFVPHKIKSALKKIPQKQLVGEGDGEGLSTVTQVSNRAGGMQKR